MSSNEVKKIKRNWDENTQNYNIQKNNGNNTNQNNKIAYTNNSNVTQKSNQQRKNNSISKVKSLNTPAKNPESQDNQKNKKEVKKTPLRIIPLGGLNEIGKNLTVFECVNDAFIVDCGLAFPDSKCLELILLFLILPISNELVLN